MNHCEHHLASNGNRMEIILGLPKSNLLVTERGFCRGESSNWVKEGTETGLET